MTRYIDGDKLIAHLKDEIKGCETPHGSRANGKGVVYGTKIGLSMAISFADTLITEDVIPKEFLTRKEDEAYERGYAEAKSEVAREIFEEIEEYLISSSVLPDCCRLADMDKIAELKKKYIGDRDDKG